MPSRTQSPSGLSLSSSGLISGTLPLTAAGHRYAVTVTVSDGSTSTSQSFEWEVTSLPLSSPGDQTSTEGVPVSFAQQVRAFLDAAPLPEPAGKLEFRQQCLQDPRGRQQVPALLNTDRRV